MGDWIRVDEKMKYNLKNFPIVEAHELCNTIDAPFDFHEAVYNWKKGFEAELREWLNEIEVAKEKGEFKKFHRLGARFLIREILGE